MSDTPQLPDGVRRRVQARTFLIQGSWNYRVMQGTGMAFALLPVLRHLALRDGDLEEALGRHAEHFNAHPYLSAVALGALSRLEVDGASPDTVRRFRSAIRGPLGALGDRLVWATWLPLSAAVGLLLYWAGAPGGWAAVVFLLLYNALHLTLRFTGFRLGFDAGTAVGPRLKSLALTRRAERLSVGLLFLVGLLAGLLLRREGAVGALGAPWAVGAAVAFATGLVGGVRLWRPTALVTVGIVVLLTFIGLRAG